MASKAAATSAVPARKTTAAKADTTSRKSNKIYCYIGPNIKGYLHTGQVFRGEREAILKENAEVVEKHPLVKTLLVPGESLAVARLKVKEPGTAHYANFQKLSRELVEAAQEKVRPEYEKYVKEE
ncbi:hypothetical protein D7X94_12945 [Acutalibacter sp. 1XD8-33]|uniref:hypothetical protein n=1 Tax=Acutalibacter sp. 1XD8-33 TaxID=2320081 RepID=UPI000EA03870|nr:hypothetical protein [Acutalibacter sp. 1XD8-33]RKJ39236.1 hypothetical protein D7X94_12945 [Acutalibacter sp. 1XD8-33]